MNLIRSGFLYVLSTSLLFLCCDFVITNYVIDVSQNKEKDYRVRHQYFDHSLKRNFTGSGVWGSESYPICTDSHGFKSSCSKALSERKKFDIAFIGDSFTEAIGLPYEKSFVGLFAQQNPDLEVANLGVASYSPSVYLKKVEWLLNEGVRFDHLVVFVDISDIQDEAVYYREWDDGSLLPNSNSRGTLYIKQFITSNFSLLTTGYLQLSGFFGQKDLKKSTDVFTLNRSSWTYDPSAEGYGTMGVHGGIEKALSYMARLDSLLVANDIKLSVGVYPWPAQLKELSKSSESNKQSQIWADFCVGKCERFIDVFPRFSDLVRNGSVESVYAKYYLQGDIHFNDLGNSEVFLEILESMKVLNEPE